MKVFEVFQLNINYDKLLYCTLGSQIVMREHQIQRL